MLIRVFDNPDNVDNLGTLEMVLKSIKGLMNLRVSHKVLLILSGIHHEGRYIKTREGDTKWRKMAP